MKNIFCVFGIIGMAAAAFSNNIAVTNAQLTGQNTTSGYTMVEFDLAWENSWRVSAAPSNRDAAWVFVKYRTAGGDWQHCFLNDSGHTAPAGSVINIGLLTPGAGFNATTNPALGAFVYRNADGAGTISLTDVQLRWNYGANGVSDNDTVDFQIFVLEMVYVPQGSFSVGSGGTGTSEIYTAPTTTSPYQITNENAITVGTATGNLYYASSTNGGDQAGPIPAAFPKGYNAFYCMKYEISQQGYADFLNTLNYTQQTTRTATAPNSTAGTGALINPNAYRNGIDIQTPGISSATPAVYACNLNGNGIYNEPADGQNIACNYMSWADLAAYLDWSGLRPMTELEFEKACRGTLAAVANEYVWGSTTVTGATTIANSGLSSEISNAGANCAYNNAAGVQGTMRVGNFAQGGTNRQNSGASYYGIMEMSGNNWERSVTIGNATGRAFTGTHGSGLLDASGNADALNWPGTTALGAGFRGGCWNYSASDLQLSDRGYGAGTDADRFSNYGSRGVRSAP